MKPCRDCNQPASPASRSCPHCGIVNPVIQWLALPDGSHRTLRLAPDPVAAAAALRGMAMPAPRMPAPLAPRITGKPKAAATAAPLPESGPEIDAIRQCANVFFALAALNALIGFFLLGSVAYIEAGIMAVLAAALRQYNSRVAAVLLVIYAALTTLSKVMVLLDGGGFRIGWIWMWVLVTGAAVKATIATFNLRRGTPAMA